MFSPVLLAPAASATSVMKPLSMVLILALVSLVPFLFMGATAFVKISTVLHIVRGAIGAQNVPSNTIITVLAAALSLVVMAPVTQAIMDRAEPLLASPSDDGIEVVRGVVVAAREPLRTFLQNNADGREIRRFVHVAQKSRPPEDRDKVRDTDFSILIPAFVVSELTRAFAIGFLLYLPFLVIDLVVANILLSLGMQMLSPTQVSLPFKLLLFVGIDGWGLLAQTLVAGYR